ncbi:MAG: glycosyltransferase [Gemmataceae bacterium]
MTATRKARVVLVHDWLTGMRGGEKCLEVVCRHWPDAPLFTLLHEPGALVPAIEERKIHTSWLQKLPGVQRYYRYLLPFMPRAAERWSLPACDLVVSMSHCVAKSARPPEGVPHVCYCFTPMRYAWHMQDAYFEKRGLKAKLIQRLLASIRAWDKETSSRVSHYVAISKTVQQRIAECYGRDSVVIYPPVDTDFYTPAAVPRDDYYLALSAFAPYKRFDLAIDACNRMKRTLIVIGTGQDMKRLQALAGPTVHFLGWQPDRVLRDHLRRCRALLFPGEEDFGIVPVEAMACGTPVIAYGKGGASETVIGLDGAAEPTGHLFQKQSVDCLVAALEQFEAMKGSISSTACRRQAERFNKDRFADEILDYLSGVLRESTGRQRRAA